MPYPAALTLQAASNVPELEAITDAVELEELRQQAIAAVESYCNQVFESEVTTYTLDGNGRERLYLPRRLETLTALEVRGTSLNVADVTVTPDGDQLIVPPVGGNYYTRALLDHDEPRAFREGVAAVAVTGTWGWSTTPAAVVTAIRKDMENQAKLDAGNLSGPVAQYRQQGIRAISQRGLSITFGQEAQGGQTGLAPGLQRSLDRYVWIGRLGESV